MCVCGVRAASGLSSLFFLSLFSVSFHLSFPTLHTPCGTVRYLLPILPGPYSVRTRCNQITATTSSHSRKSAYSLSVIVGMRNRKVSRFEIKSLQATIMIFRERRQRKIREEREMVKCTVMYLLHSTANT